MPHSAGFTGRTARLMTGYILDYYGYGFNGIGSFHNSIINGIIETLKSEVGDWINLVFVVKTFILGLCYGK